VVILGSGLSNALILSGAAQQVSLMVLAQLLSIEVQMSNIFNPSHCKDLTAKCALDNIENQKKKTEQARRAKDMLGCVIRICSLAGYEVLDIAIRSRRDGTTYKKKKNNE
jgi:hypothetical protein